MWSQKRTQSETGKPSGYKTATLTFYFNRSPSLWGQRAFFSVPLCISSSFSFLRQHFSSFSVNIKEDVHPQTPQSACPSRGQQRLVIIPNSLHTYSAWVGMQHFPMSCSWADRIHVVQTGSQGLSPVSEVQGLEKGACISFLTFFSSIRGSQTLTASSLLQVTGEKERKDISSKGHVNRLVWIIHWQKTLRSRKTSRLRL